MEHGEQSWTLRQTPSPLARMDHVQMYLALGASPCVWGPRTLLIERPLRAPSPPPRTHLPTWLDGSQGQHLGHLTGSWADACPHLLPGALCEGRLEAPAWGGVGGAGRHPTPTPAAPTFTIHSSPQPAWPLFSISSL